MEKIQLLNRYENDTFSYKKSSLTSLLLPLAFVAFIPQNAQAAYLDNSDAKVLVSANTLGKASYKDYTIPFVQDGTKLKFDLKGGDGGKVILEGKRNADGGRGAILNATFSVGESDSSLRQGGVVRFIVGYKGNSKKTEKDSPFKAGGGGGGTAVLYKNPGAISSDCILPTTDLTVANISYDDNKEDNCWVILTVAGGGGGGMAGQNNNASHSHGNAATIEAKAVSEGGTAGKKRGGSGAGYESVSDSPYKDGRPGKLTGDIGGGHEKNAGKGGQGYGGGGSGAGGKGDPGNGEKYRRAAGGGGGGFRGGAGGYINRGGAGGYNFFSSDVLRKNTELFDKKGTVNPKNGYIKYTLSSNSVEQTGINIIAHSNITIGFNDSLDNQDIARVTTEMLDNGSYYSIGGLELCLVPLSNVVAAPCLTGDSIYSEPGEYELKLRAYSVDDGFDSASGLPNTFEDVLVSVTVEDDRMPIIDCIEDIKVSTTSASCSVLIDLPEVAVIDNGGSENITLSYVLNKANEFYYYDHEGTGVLASQSFNVGTSSLVYTATDATGLSASCEIDIVVVDKVAPTATCHDIEIELENNAMASITASQLDGLGGLVAGSNSSDSCGEPVVLSVDKKNFSCNDLGVNNVTLTVVDNNNNSSTCDAKVTVVDSYYSVDNTLFFQCQVDRDSDGVDNKVDNCPDTPNPDQINSDNDANGDACDTDNDNDEYLDVVDNCPITFNSDQSDIDSDGVGDACDDDSDGDYLLNGVDNCPLIENSAQADFDEDGLGDACDDDSDADEVPNDEDNCLLNHNPSQKDLDSDEIGDVCDDDIDGDNVPNYEDNCPNISNPSQSDENWNNIGDACEREVVITGQS